MPNIVKITTILNPLDLLAPHTCRGCGALGKPLCDRCKNYIIKTRQTICPNCKTPIRTSLHRPSRPYSSPSHMQKCPSCHNLPPIYAISRRSGLLGDLISQFKYSSIRALAISFASLLDQILPSTPPKTFLVPLPTIAKHIRTRGLDHTRLIAKRLARLRGQNTHLLPLLLRAKDTVQVGSDKNTRLTQAASAYKLNPKYKIDSSATYILIDDVWTTGASMLSAVKKLQKAGARNIIIAVLAIS